MSFYCIYHCYIYHLFGLLHLSRFISESASGSVDASWSLKSLFVVLRMFSTWLALERSPPTPGHPIVFLMPAAAQLRHQVQSDADCGSPLPVVRLVTLIVALCVALLSTLAPGHHTSSLFELMIGVKNTFYTHTH